MLAEVLGQVSVWLDRRDRRAEREDAAVRAILEAVNQTKRYIAALKRGEIVKRDSEADLVTLWTDAAVSLRRSDPELASRLQAKAEYWADPENWTREEIDGAGIRIEDIAEKARSLL